MTKPHPDCSSSSRILLVGGLLLVVASMSLGVYYATSISHVANAEIKQAWQEVMASVAQSDLLMVKQHFAVIADLTEKRGRIMNGHSHLGACGLLLLTLATLQPLSSLKHKVKFGVACATILGGLFLFSGVIMSYYAARQSLFLSDIGAMLLLAAVGASLYGMMPRRTSTPRATILALAVFQLQSSSSRMLLKAGVLLVLIGMILGLYIAWLLVSGDESMMLNSISESAQNLARRDLAAAQASIAAFKMAQLKMAINAAAHSHGIEMGFLIILLALNRNIIALREGFFLAWSMVFIFTCYALPAFIFLAINYYFGFAQFANSAGATLAALLLIVVIASTVNGTSSLEST